MMTKNEYKQYLIDCTNRWYTDKTYTKEQYEKDLDSVEIAPLDLSKYYAIKKETKKWINTLFDEEDVDRKGNYMLRGFTRREGVEMQVLGLTYGEYANAYSFYAYNDDEYLIYTYCEGDTTLKPFKTRGEYEKEKAETIEWYKEAYA